MALELYGVNITVSLPISESETKIVCILLSYGIYVKSDFEYLVEKFWFMLIMGHMITLSARLMIISVCLYECLFAQGSSMTYCR